MNSGLLVAALMCLSTFVIIENDLGKEFVDEKNTVRDLKWTMP